MGGLAPAVQLNVKRLSEVPNTNVRSRTLIDPIRRDLIANRVKFFGTLKKALEEYHGAAEDLDAFLDRLVMQHDHMLELHDGKTLNFHLASIADIGTPPEVHYANGVRFGRRPHPRCRS